MGIEESYKELNDHLKHLKNIGLSTEKINSIQHSIDELYNLSKESMKFEIGEKVKIIKEIDFKKSWGWAPFKKELSVGCTGIVKKYCYNTYRKYPYVDLEVIIPGINGKETTIFLMPVSKLGKL